MIRTIRVAVLLLSLLVVPTVAQAAFISFGATVINLINDPVDYDSAFITAGAALGLGPTTDLGVNRGFPPCVAVRAPVTCTFSLVTSTFAPTVFDSFEARLA